MNTETFCAIIENNVVTNIIVLEADSPLLNLNSNWVFIGNNPESISLGWSFDGSNFIKPAELLTIIQPKIITKLAFRFRLIDSEYVGILTAAKTDIEVAAWVETFNMVNQINLDDDRTKNGVSTLIAKNLLTNERANEILTAEVQSTERP